MSTMPDNIEAEKPVVTESPNRIVDAPNKPEDKEPKENPGEFIIIPQQQQHNSPPILHPYTRPLTISDLESVVALENAAFSDPKERATREKVRRCSPTSRYRQRAREHTH